MIASTVSRLLSIVSGVPVLPLSFIRAIWLSAGHARNDYSLHGRGLRPHPASHPVQALSSGRPVQVRALPRERVGPRVKMRLPEPYIAGLRALALKRGIPFSDYLRDLVRQHLLEMGPQFGESGVRFDRFTRSVKQFILAYREPVVVSAGLPAKPKREELEHLTWDAVLRAYEFAKSEEAAAHAKASLRAMEVLANLVRAERLILQDQDKAAVDDLVEEVEANLRSMEKELRENPRNGTSAEPET